MSLPIRGHNDALGQLRRACERCRLGQAFLFIGPEGIGKRGLARFVAQGLLCAAPSAPLQPCGRCPDCVQVDADTHPDLFIAGRPAEKHELPIAVIADLCASLALKPARGRYKIAIVDDADQLNEEAANCFLKTLEEPPPRSLLILLATSAEMQLATVVSRCQVVRFGGLSDELVAEILREHGVAREPAEAARLARWGAGSVSRACQFAQPDWIELRDQLARQLADPRSDSVALTQAVQRFIDDAGKEAAAKRERARSVIELVADLYSEALRHQQRGDPQAPIELEHLAGFDTETLLELLERCVQADYHVRRFLHQSLAVDCWLDDLAQISAGKRVAPIG